MKNLIRSIFILILSLGAHAGEIRLVPDDNIILNATNSGRGQFDFILHSIIISTSANENFKLEKIEIEVGNNEVSIIKSISAENIAKETAGMNQMLSAGMGVFFNGQILNTSLLKKIEAKEVNLADSTDIADNELLITTRKHFNVDFIPEKLIVRAFGKNHINKSVILTKEIGVAPYTSAIDYQMPVSGTWLVTGDASIHSHHRLVPSTEYAIDFFKSDDKGQFKKGDDLDANSYYAYGQDIRAAAKGVVVHVVANQVQNRAAMTQKQGENIEDAMQRVGQYINQRYRDNFETAAAGNLIVIKHHSGETVEYSSYGHLKAGSVLVKIGDKVNVGDKIAEVGDTGDSALAHLHFQINAGKTPFYTKSLPITFSDMDYVASSVDALKFVNKSIE